MSYYQTLNLTSEATTREVKDAFRELSKKLHPDMPGGGRDKFHEVYKAYSTLADPVKRRLYDTNGYQEIESLSLTDLARNKIIAITGALLTSKRFVADYEDLVVKIRSALNEELSGSLTTRKEAENTLRVLDSMRERTTNGKYILIALENEEKRLHSVILSCTSNIEVNKLAKKEIDSYEYRTDTDTD